MNADPAIGEFVSTCGYATNVHDEGTGHPLLLLHGSGSGVTAWANWRNLIPKMADRYRVVAPDLVGFGYTKTPEDFGFQFMGSWVDQIISLLDSLEIERTHVLGNSFGGSLAMALAVRHPDRFDRLVLMGPGGWPTKVNANLEELWSYKPSIENMKRLLDIMAFDRSLVTDELAELRYKATLRPGSQETFERLFPAPRQRWLDAQIVAPADLMAMKNEVLIIHGRDDIVVDPQVSWNLHQHIPNSQLHVFGNCGHWTMIEHGERFRALISQFYGEAGG
jgi:2-hydroxymuconate-semialdehyde hydrolase